MCHTKSLHANLHKGKAILTETALAYFRLSVWFHERIVHGEKPRQPASIGTKLPTLGEQFGRLEDRIQKIGGQPLPALKNPRRK